jgi:hypothetical protein
MWMRSKYIKRVSHVNDLDLRFWICDDGLNRFSQLLAETEHFRC